MTAYDSSKDITDHIKAVQDSMSDVAVILLQRAKRHDRSKLEPPEKEIYDRVLPQLKMATYNSPEYKELLEQMGEGLRHHYAHNSHHPQHYADGVAGMDVFDLIEMVCDLKATIEAKGKPLAVEIDANIEYFGIEPQLAQILKNTVDRWPSFLPEEK